MYIIVFNLLYINQYVKVNFVGYLIVDFLRWIFYAAAKQAKLSGKMSKDSFRKDLSMPGLLREMRECFDRVPDLIISRGITLSDCLMAGLAMFSLKIPSMLKYDQLVRLDENTVQAKNLKSLFGVKQPPSDTWLRERLDGVDPRSLRRCFKIIFSFLQRGNVLKNWTVFDGHYLIAIDGTGCHSSHKVRCKNCCVKNHRNGKTTYYHQMLGAAIIHPEHKEVLPLAPEPILKEDGADKNDCERNAAKRLVNDLRREHPHLKAIIVEDALASNGPHINHLKNKGFRYILGAKPGDHERLFRWFDASETKESWKVRDKKTGTVHHYEWDIGLPLNDANFHLKVNMLKYKETNKKGEIKRFSWVTDLPLDRDTVTLIMRAGRRRWAIENETFKTLKDRDIYNFEHNYGHGKKNLAVVLPMLAMLSLLIDQTQQHCRQLSVQDDWGWRNSCWGFVYFISFILLAPLGAFFRPRTTSPSSRVPMSGGVQKRWLSVKSRIIRSYFEKKPRSRKKSKMVEKRIKLLQYDKKIHLPGEDHTRYLRLLSGEISGYDAVFLVRQYDLDDVVALIRQGWILANMKPEGFITGDSNPQISVTKFDCCDIVGPIETYQMDMEYFYDHATGGEGDECDNC